MSVCPHGISQLSLVRHLIPYEKYKPYGNKEIKPVLYALSAARLRSEMTKQKVETKPMINFRHQKAGKTIIWSRDKKVNQSNYRPGQTLTDPGG